MDNMSQLVQGIGALAELFLMFYRAQIGAGATDEEAVILTALFMSTVMDQDEPEELS